MPYGATPSTQGGGHQMAGAQEAQGQLIPGLGLALKAKLGDLQTRASEEASRICDATDVPALAMPWFLYALALVPLALLEEQFLGYISTAVVVVLSLGFLLLSRGRAWFVLACVCFAMTVLGAGLGRYDHFKYVAEFSIYQRSPSFSNVLASEDPGAFQDGAFFEFSRDARVDISRGLGYKSDDTWCVAPIVDGPQDVVGFWAVGTNCCRSRGFFDCGDVHNSSLHSGLAVLDNRQVSSPEIPFYQLAVKMAAETYQIGLPRDPIFIRWGVTPSEALQSKMGSAVLFTLFALFAGLLAVPTLVVVLNLTDLSLTKSDSEVAKQMIFGFEWTPRDYDQQLQLDLLNHRCYWSGEVIYDYAFHLANKHLFLGPFICHPAHPFSKWERTIVLTVICLLIVFPVAAFSVKFGQTGMTRTILVAVFATLPRNLLKLYLIDVSQEDAQIELEGAPDASSKQKIREAETYEYVFLTVSVIVTAIICGCCVAFIKGHTDESVGSVLGRNCDGLGFAFVLEIAFDLLIPFFGDAEYAHQATLGFFGRWRWERDDFAEGKAPLLKSAMRPPEATQMKRLSSRSQGGAGALLAQQQPPVQ